MVFIPGWGTKIPHTSQVQPKKKKKEANQRETFLQWMLKESSVFLPVKLINIFLKGKKNCVTSNKNSEGEIKEIIPFIIVSKRIKCLGKKIT